MHKWLESLSVMNLAFILVLATSIVILSSIRLTKLADQLADRFNLGEAFVGSVLVGATTSLSGIVVTSKTAWDGFPDLAVSNAIGSIAIQTVFLVLADFMYRKSNLEHAAASLPNIFSGILLIILLALPLAVQFISPITMWGIHPVSPLIIIVYMAGLRMQRISRLDPMWIPKQTNETIIDRPSEISLKLKESRLILNFVGIMPIIAAMGWILSQAAENLVRRTQLSEGVVGTLKSPWRISCFGKDPSIIMWQRNNCSLFAPHC